MVSLRVSAALAVSLTETAKQRGVQTADHRISILATRAQALGKKHKTDAAIVAMHVIAMAWHAHRHLPVLRVSAIFYATICGIASHIYIDPLAIHNQDTGGPVPTSLPPHETDGCCHPFSRVGINVDHEKRVDLGFLRHAECIWGGAEKPISAV